MDEKVPSIIECISPGGVFSEYFGNDLSSWAGHITILKSIYGLPMTPEELTFWQTYTNRQTPDPAGYEDVVIAAGRRSGKTVIASLLCCYEALFGGFDEQLKPGERAHCFLLASVMKQAGEAMTYCKALLRAFERVVGTEVIVNDRFNEWNFSMASTCQSCRWSTPRSVVDRSLSPPVMRLPFGKMRPRAILRRTS